MYPNGRFPASALAPIPGGRLEREAAAAYNAMNAEAVRRFGVTLWVRDSYRPLGQPGDYQRGVWDQWAAWERYLYHGGNLAARPGTSNHGLAKAIDAASQKVRWVIDQIGRAYGWAKAWSDAPSEWWHLAYRYGIWHGKVVRVMRPIHFGMHGKRVRLVQWMLRKARTRDHKPYWPRGLRLGGHFGLITRRGVKRFQRAHGLPADGVVGARTWKALKAATR